MARLFLLSLANIMKGGAGGRNCKVVSAKPKTIKRRHAELRLQKLAGAFERKGPLVERRE